jgi:septum formation protein
VQSARSVFTLSRRTWCRDPTVDLRPPLPADFQLILASQSPRRQSLLRDIGIPFRIARSTANEALEGVDAGTLAENNAAAKVRGVELPKDVAREAFVLGTDTVVAVEGRILGKAPSAEVAAEMLAMLSGRTHQVVSGVALLRGAHSLQDPVVGSHQHDMLVAHAVTDVSFLPLTDVQIETYVASGEWRGKAGAYAIQGLAGVFVSGVRGEYSNVVGLPLCLLAQMFCRLGFDLLGRSWWTGDGPGGASVCQ